MIVSHSRPRTCWSRLPGCARRIIGSDGSRAMRNLGRFPAIELALLVVLIGPEAGSARQASTPAQNGLQTGTIVVLGNDGGLQLVHAPVSIRVHSEAIRVDLNVTVGNLTVASFDDLPAGQYLVEIAVSGFEPAQI